MGTHWLIDAWGSSAQRLNDVDAVRQALLSAIAAGNATLVELCVHQFSPQGVTATATLAESHIAIHTWPEHGYFAADLFFCASGHPQQALAALCEHLAVTTYKTTKVRRGYPERSAHNKTTTSSSLNNCSFMRSL